MVYPHDPGWPSLWPSGTYRVRSRAVDVKDRPGFLFVPANEWCDHARARGLWVYSEANAPDSRLHVGKVPEPLDVRTYPTERLIPKFKPAPPPSGRYGSSPEWAETVQQVADRSPLEPRIPRRFGSPPAEAVDPDLIDMLLAEPDE
jgi:hypothetical protein